LGPSLNLIVFVVGKHEENRPLSRSNCRWEDAIKIYFSEGWHGDVDWVNMAQHKVQWRNLVNIAMNLWVPQRTGRFLPTWTVVSFRRSN
jgi:hypothetical protein